MESPKRDTAEALRDIQWLNDQPQWKRLTLLIEKQIAVRQNLLSRPIATPQEQAQHNVYVGEVAGLSFLLAAPQRAIAALLETQPSIKSSSTV